MPQKYGRFGTIRPFGPRGLENVQQSSATCGRVALGHGPGGGRVPDQRALAGDQRAVVGGIVVADGVGAA